MDIYRTPEERFRDLPDYPFAPHTLDLDGLRMHTVDEGQGDPVLMLHGEPTWSFLYRKMITPIAAKHRAVAPDYIGFGKSDKPTDDAYYTFAHHFANLEAFARALDLNRITLVMQDWGGPLGLHFATRHPERIARLVILNTGLLSGAEASFTRGLRIWIERSQKILEGSIGEMMRRAPVSGPLSDEVARGYDAPFPNRESKAGARRFPLMIPQSPADPGGPEMIETRDALSRWNKPTLVMFSDSDRVFPPSVAEGFIQLIPNAEGPILIKGAGHYVQEEAGEELARHILDFMDRT
ncbi:MAG: alpha/beta fold hydrolase [Chloroflexi bacterium]|nr:alpha/beta fold hydrolase [Chloroflexota bacterium]MBI3732821.1 alpha/beta fold hydrolase [Chloroflexota bacterium]